MKLAIVTGGFLPVPATKGGAVENLIQNFMNENEKYNDFNITIFSDFDENAKEEIKKYNNSNVIFIKPNFIINIIDKVIFFIAKNVLRKKNSHSYRFIMKRLNYLNQVSKYLKKKDFDKVLLENHPTQYLSLKWRKNYIKYAGKYYYHCHNEIPGLYGCKNIIDKTAKFASVSEFSSKALREYLNLDNDIFTVVRNGIDESKFKIKLSEKEKYEIRKKYNIEKNHKVLIFAGRIVPEKGIKELVMSLKNVKYKDYKLLIVGSALNEIKTKTMYQLEVENLINEINDKVIYTGFIKYEEIPKLYNIADIAVLPSIWNDPAPLTIIESLSCGLPIITTESGGIPEYAVNGSAIILKRDEKLIENLSKEIDELLNNEKKCELMSKKSLNASKELTISRYYKDMYNCLK